MTDRINHPPHYGGADNPYEAIKVIEAHGLGFKLGNAAKYISRAGKKPGVGGDEDIRKALWYVRRASMRPEPPLRVTHDVYDAARIVEAWGLTGYLAVALRAVLDSKTIEAAFALEQHLHSIGAG